ncbi:MAG: shikimate kinase [Lachnospiraceae bacterium]|nr:shikimate kinase [Lachnospiraceae bacterium]
MRKGDNITLIGMPGAGKSTIGVVLAKRLGYRFVDTDLLIQEQEKRLLKEIIAEEGLEGFKAIENQVNADLVADHSVIAPGGSVVYCREAMEHLKQLGLVVYLRVSYEELASRLGDLVDRGVALKEGQGLKELMEERGIQYEKYADYIIDEDGLTPGRIAAILEKKLIKEKMAE